MATRFGIVVIAMAVACGGSTGQPPRPVANTTPPASVSRDRVVRDALSALAAGDVAGLMALADPAGMFESAIACNREHGNDDLSPDAKQVQDKLRADFTKAADKSRGSRVEVVSIRNEMRSWIGRKSRDRNATFIVQGGAVADGCVARTDLMFHEVEAKIRVEHDGANHETKVKLELVQAHGRWYLIKVPVDLGHDGPLAKMSELSQRMCGCKDKACADQVNDDMTKWGMEMARTSDPDERPDPDVIKQATELMTRYSDCMMKLMSTGTPP